ncbi:MAG: Bax inhibitor-1/YccA family protein [Actinomycetota bacterium]
MANPLLNEKKANEAAAGWAAPTNDQMAARSTTIPGSPLTAPPTMVPPISDGPVSTWHGGTFTVGGTATATAVLLIILLASAAFGWSKITPVATGTTNVGFPGLAIAGIIVGFICAIVVSFKPMLAKVLGPIYALGEGFFLGVISHYYNIVYKGVVVQAVGATIGVFVVMLFLYRTRIIKVTARFKRAVITAMFGLMAFYMVSFIINIFSPSAVSFLHNGSGLGIIISIFAAGLASMMLAIDFDLIEKGANAGWPKGMEWYAAFGLLTTLVWLYLELLRLFAALNRR